VAVIYVCHLGKFQKQLGSCWGQWSLWGTLW